MVDLSVPPDWLTFTEFAGESVVGWKYLTEPDGPGRVKPRAVMLVTDCGYYEFHLADGICSRAGVLHKVIA